MSKSDYWSKQKSYLRRLKEIMGQQQFRLREITGDQGEQKFDLGWLQEIKDQQKLDVGGSLQIRDEDLGIFKKKAVSHVRDVIFFAVTFHNTTLRVLILFYIFFNIIYWYKYVNNRNIMKISVIYGCKLGREFK
jgi:hypothetical protein